MVKSRAEINEAIEGLVATYFTGERAKVAEVNIPSLNQRIALQLEGGREIYISIPFDPNAPKPDWETIKQYAMEHRDARLLLWLNGEIKEL